MADFWAQYDKIVEENLVPLITQIVRDYARPVYEKQAARTSSLSDANYVAEILKNAHPSVIQKEFQMLIWVFKSLQTMMLENSWLSSSKCVDITEKLAIFFTAVGSDQSN